MAKIKVIEKAHEVSWSVTRQGRISVNGKEVEYRLFEADHGADLFILEEGTGWTNAPVDLDTYDIVFDLLMEVDPEDLGEIGEEFNFDLA
jgi:hypothetical protein